MKLISSLLLAAAISVSTTAAFAACPDKSESGTTDKTNTAGISKDGTHAPLETNEQSGNTQMAQKDGKSMPLAPQEGGGNKNLATSQQDVVAQQKGDKTAAASADDKCDD